MSANEMTIGTVLRAHAPRAPESLRTQVLALEPRRAPSRRLVLVLALALAAGLAAAIVHGLVSSGPKPQPAAVHGAAPDMRKGSTSGANAVNTTFGTAVIAAYVALTATHVPALCRTVSKTMPTAV